MPARPPDLSLGATAIVQNNGRAIGLMVLSMGLFAIEDMLIKLLSIDLGTGQIMLILAGAGAVFFTLVAWQQGTRLLTRDIWSRAVVVRNVGEIIGTVAIVTAIALTPLSVASSILQATPLVVTMGAALFLGEKVGWRRWSAVTIGFLGVLLIIRPGSELFDPNALFAVIAVFGLGARDLATRVLPSHITSLQVSAYAYWALVPPSIILMLFQDGWEPVQDASSLYLGLAIVIGVAAYYILTYALRIGDLSIIAPFRYSRLIFALILAMIVFGERPDAMTLTGAALIICTGLYALYRERVRRAAAARSINQA